MKKIIDWFSQQKYWLKGGIILGGLSVIVLILIMLPCVFKIESLCQESKFWFIYFSLPFLFAIEVFQSSGSLPGFLETIGVWIITVIGYFFIGAVIGWVVRRIKQIK